jgi:hypothetical protein
VLALFRGINLWRNFPVSIGHGCGDVYPGNSSTFLARMLRWISFEPA